jgi:uncharacterized membrane protein YoaK (UPF0700 family)
MRFRRALLASYMVVCVMSVPITDARAPLTLAYGLLGACAMGVQNAHGRLAARSVIQNTVMTGNVTQAAIDIFDLLSSRCDPQQRRMTRARLSRTLPAVAGFAIGAAAGAVGYLRASFWALLLPLAALSVLAVLSRKTGAAQAAI